MSDYKVSDVSKEGTLRREIFGYIIWLKETMKFINPNDVYKEAEKSINIILEEIISLLKKGDKECEL